MEDLLCGRWVLRFPSQFLNKRDLLGDALLEVGNLMCESPQFLLLIESSVTRPEDIAEQVLFKLEHIAA